MKQTKVSGVFEVSAAPDNGVSSFKQTVFIRQDSAPPTPTGGSYADPYPDEEGWEDGIPDGNNALWASNRIFTSDGRPPQQEKWSVPKPMADTSSFRVRYSSVKNPSGNPDEAPSEWTETGSDDTRWIATIAKENGVWGVWVVTQIVGESAEYYMVMAEVASISRTKDGYSPYIFEVSEYHVKGAEKESSNIYYFHIYGIKGGTRTYIGYSAMVKEYAFNASGYYESDYDTFLFELREGSDVDSKLLASTSVSVSRDGKDGADGKNGSKGYSGAKMRMRDWEPWTDYMSGADGEEWYDVVKYKDVLYLCTYSHNSETTTPQEHVANHTGRWEDAKEWAFIATKLLLAERIKSDMIDTDDLVAKRIYTTPPQEEEETETASEEEKPQNMAHIEIEGSEMKVFNPLGLMNIRFGVTTRKKTVDGEEVDEWYSVLEYYDNDGRKLYDLGPEGITTIPVNEESWTELWYEKLGHSISEVLENKDYTRKLFNAANKVYKYHSKIVAGVVDDEENNGRLFTTKALNDEYVLEDGIYRIAPSSTSGNNVFMSIDSRVIEDAVLEGKAELDATDLPGLSSYNERVMVRNPVYAEQLYRCEGGFMASSGTTAYWNGKPVASEA